jgi:ribosomal protein L11 methyltransferase
MDQNYLELNISIPDEYQEIFITELMDLDFEGFEQFDEYILAYIPNQKFNDVSRETIEILIASQPVPCQLNSEKIYEPQNWNENWEKTIEPIEVGQFYIRPTWKPIDTPEGLILLEIDPKMAFGTGYHETTRCILRMLPSVVSKGCSVLDVGTGTGILAIAALKLNAGRAFGFDVDEWSYDNAMENAYLNGVADRFEVKEGSFDTVPAGDTYDLVLANVNRNMLLGTSSQISTLVSDGGTLVLSGLLDVDEDIILMNYDYSRLKLIDRIQENEWICLRFHKF